MIYSRFLVLSFSVKIVWDLSHSRFLVLSFSGQDGLGPELFQISGPKLFYLDGLCPELLQISGHRFNVLLKSQIKYEMNECKEVFSLFTKHLCTVQAHQCHLAF